MGRDWAAEAMATQTKTGYRADMWIVVDLEPMTKLWQGIGGHSNFFFSEEDAREAKGAYVGTKAYRFAETLWRHAQVEPNAALGYRDGIREYVVNLPTRAAFGVCRENPHLGSGSVVQYYLPGWESLVHATGREFKFGEKAFPKL